MTYIGEKYIGKNGQQYCRRPDELLKTPPAKRRSAEKWNAAHPEINRAAQKKWRRENALQIKAHKHGLTESSFLALYEKQRGLCAVCHLPLGTGRDLSVDHDHACCPSSHSCGQCVRGLLHNACNALLAFAKDDASRLLSAAKYLDGVVPKISPTVIGKRFSFDAAHYLPLHQGKCRRKHGHTYVLEVDVTGQMNLSSRASDQNMVVDYYILKQVVDEEIMNRFDHQDLNEVIKPFDIRDPNKENVTTAENMVGIFAGLLSNRLSSTRYGVSRVRLCETQSSWAEWRP